MIVYQKVGCRLNARSSSSDSEFQAQGPIDLAHPLFACTLQKYGKYGPSLSSRFCPLEDPLTVPIVQGERTIFALEKIAFEMNTWDPCTQLRSARLERANH